MRLRKSGFVHQIHVGRDSILLIHAISQLRLKVDDELGRLMIYFSEWREFPAAFAEIAKFMPYDDQVLAGSIDALRQRGLLTDKDADAELAEVVQKLSPTLGRDPRGTSRSLPPGIEGRHPRLLDRQGFAGHPGCRQRQTAN